MVSLSLLAMTLSASAATPPVEPRVPERQEIWVPLKDWDSVMQKHPGAVMLSREQYEALVRDAGKTKPIVDSAKVLHGTVIESMHFQATAVPGEPILRVTGEVKFKALSDEWHAAELKLPFQDLVKAELDGSSQLTAGESFSLLCKGKGEHRLKLEFLHPLTLDVLKQQSTLVLKQVAHPATLELNLPPNVTLIDSPSATDGAGLHRWSISDPKEGNLAITWADPGTMSATAAKIIMGTLSIQDDALRSSWHVELRGGSEVAAFEVAPTEARVENVTGPNLVSWKQVGSRLEIQSNGKHVNQVVQLTTPIPDALLTSDAAQELPLPRLVTDKATPTMSRIEFTNQAEHLELLELRGGEVLGNTLLWSMGKPAPTFLLRRSQPHLTLDSDATITVNKDDLSIERLLTLEIDRPMDLFSVTLPADEEFVSTHIEGSSGWEWRRTGRVMQYRWSQALAAGRQLPIQLLTRKRLTVGSPISVENIAAPSVKKLAGYVALNFDPQWRVNIREAQGLEERDARNTPVKGRMAWFGLRDFKLTLETTRRDPIFDAEVVAYALPRARTCEIEGQVALTITDAPLRELAVKFPTAEAALLRWTSPLIGEQTLDKATGLWQLTLRRETLGRVVLRFRLSLPAIGDATDAKSTATKLSAALPTPHLPAARRFNGIWVIEANTDTELSFAAKSMQPLDVLKAPVVEGYTLRHRAIAAYQYGSPEATLKLEATRHAHGDLATMLVTDFRMLSVLERDGLVRHQAMFEVQHSGEQFFTTTLPTGASLLSSLVNGLPVKPVRNAEGSTSIALPPAEVGNASASVRLVYEQTTTGWTNKGVQQLQPPKLAPEIAILHTDWRLYVPAGYEIGKIPSGLEEIRDQRLDRLGGEYLPGSGQADDPAVWASQPGAVRTYNDDGQYLGGRSLFSTSTPMPLETNGTLSYDRAAPLSELAEREILERRSRMLSQVSQEWEPGKASELAAAAPPAAATFAGNIQPITMGGTLVVGSVSETTGPIVTPPSPAPIAPAKAGLMSLDVTLPEGGQFIRLTGGVAPTPISLRYTSWERLLVEGCLLAVLGALAFWWVGRRRWLVKALLVAVLVWQGAPLLSAEVARVASAFAVGWLACLLGWRVVRLAQWWEAPAVSATQVATALWLLGSVTVGFAEEADPAKHEVFVPYTGAPTSAEADRYYLDRGVFDRLWALAKENRKPAKVDDADDAKPTAQVISALYQIRFEAERYIIEGRLSVSTRGKWAQLALPVTSSDKPVPLSQIQVDGKPGALIATGELQLATSGMHEIVAQWEGKASADEELVFRLPDAAAGLVQVLPAAMEGWPRFSKQNTPLYESTPQRSAVVKLPPQGQLTFRRMPRHSCDGRGLPAAASSEAVLDLTQHQAPRLTWEARYRFPGAAVSEVGILLDPAWRVIQLGDQLHANRIEWREHEGQAALFFGLATEVTDALELNLVLEPVSLDALRTMPRVVPIAVRAESNAAVVWEKALKVEVDGLTDAIRLPAPEGHESRSLRWKQAANAPVKLRIDTDPGKQTAEMNYLFQVSGQKLELALAAALSRSRGAYQQVRLALPANMEVQSVQGPALAAWYRDGQDLLAHFKPVLRKDGGGDLRLVVHLARTAAQSQSDWELEPVVIAGMEEVKSRVIVAGHAATEVKLANFTPGHSQREVDPSALDEIFTVADPIEKKRAVELEGAAWKLPVTLADLPVRFSADAMMLVQATPGALALSQQILLSVEQGALSKVLLKLPAALPEATVTGELLREVQTRVVGTQREYECSFQSQGGLRGWTTLTLDTQLPLADAELVVPMIQIPQVDRLRRFFVLDNSSDRGQRIVTSQAVEPCAKDALPYLPDVLTKPQFFRGTIGAAADQGLRVSWSQLQSTESNAAVVTLADIKTLIRPDGERWDTVSFMVFNRSLQFLPVILDPKAELIAVSVAGEAVRADVDQRQGKTVRLVPLIQTQVGQRSMEVKLVYRLRGSGSMSASLKMDDPEVQGLSAERTVWSLSLPPGYELDRRMTDLFGNMEEVPSEARVVAETESWLSDLVRLNKSFSLRSTFSSKKKLIEEGDKMVAQLEQKIDDLESKLSTKQRYSYDAIEGKDAISGEVAKLKQELASQQIVLTENRIAQPEFDAPEIPQFGNTWTSQAGKPLTSPVPTYREFDNGLNDNIAVNGGFLINNGTVSGDVNLNSISNVSSLSSNARGNFNFNNTLSNAVSNAPQPKILVPAAKPKAVPATVTATAAPAAPAPAPQKAAPVDEEKFEDFLQPTAQLRATGRRSMQVEMPLTANTFHFRKLKDHAVLEVALSTPSSAAQNRRLWIFLGSLAAVGLVWFLGQQSRRPA